VTTHASLARPGPAVRHLGSPPGDVVTALQGQNVQVASACSTSRRSPKRAFQIAVRTLGRLVDPKEFADIVVSRCSTAVVPLRNVGRIELAAATTRPNSIAISTLRLRSPFYPTAGSNAAGDGQKDQVDNGRALEEIFPQALEYTIIYNPTEFIQQSIDAVTETIVEAILLVVLVVILFLADLAAPPFISDRGNYPVSLNRGTFLHGASFGFSLNNLFAVRPGCSPSASRWSTMRSSWWRTWSATSPPAMASA